MADFSELLQEAEKLTSDIEGSLELPKVDRSLRQVLEDSNDLYARVAQNGPKDIQANLLLGSKGVDLPKIVHKLEMISSKRTFEPVEPVDDRDVNYYLENQIRNCILKVIETEHQKCSSSIYEQGWEHMLGEWKQEKRKIISALVAPSGAFLEAGRSSTIAMDVSSTMSPNLTYEESVYARKVVEYNKTVVRSLQKPNLINVFSEAAEEFKDAKINEMWEIIRTMNAPTPPFPNSEDTIQSRYKKHVIEVLVRQGRKYLENRYRVYMNNIINENLMTAMRGGQPGTFPLVCSFVRMRFQGDFVGLEDGFIENCPFWPVVYYCLRSGDISAALHCLKNNNIPNKEGLVNILEKKFNNPDDPTIAKSEASLRFQYHKYIRNATDPFKRIVWSVLGCCDVVDEHSEVATTADDYLWLKLSLVRTDYGKDDHVEYADLQRIIVDEYGETHYDAVHQPHLYFQVLALTGQFESALEFLFRTERYRTHSVHMAIALNEQYIIANPRDVMSPLLCTDPEDPKPSRRLNIARLIMTYVRKFEILCPAEALHYFFLLRNLSTVDKTNLFIMCVTDLMLETKEYERILGKIQPNGMRSKALIDQFVSSNISAEEIASVTADRLAKKGLFEDAIELYDLANNQEQVLSLCCTLLSQVVFLQKEPGSLRNRLQAKVVEVSERYSTQGYNCSANAVLSFKVLKDLLGFFDYYHNKQYNLALKVLNDIKLVPISAEDLDECISSFRRLNFEVCKIIPDVLLAKMNILFTLYQSIKSPDYASPRGLGNKTELQLEPIRNQAKILTNFSGMLPYRMPSDTNSRLVQMEILMH